MCLKVFATCSLSLTLFTRLTSIITAEQKDKTSLRQINSWKKSLCCTQYILHNVYSHFIIVQKNTLIKKKRNFLQLPAVEIPAELLKSLFSEHQLPSRRMEMTVWEIGEEKRDTNQKNL